MDEFIDKYVFAVGTDATSVNVQETEVLTILYLFFNSFTFQPNFCRIHTPFFKAILIKQ
jgi:hypothetical protein